MNTDPTCTDPPRSDAGAGAPVSQGSPAPEGSASPPGPTTAQGPSAPEGSSTHHETTAPEGSTTTSPAPAPAAPATTARRGPRPVGKILAVALVFLVAINLRAVASGVGPLLEDITGALGGGPVAAGLLTALPCLAFGVMGLVAVPVARRTGLTGSVVLAGLALVLGQLLRPMVHSIIPFLVLSAIALAGPALANVVLPAWIKRHGGRRAVLLMTLYTSMLSLGGSLGALLAVPLDPGTAEGWRASLMFWAILGVPWVLVTVLVLNRTGHDFPPPEPGGHVQGSMFRSPTAIALTAMFALQSAQAYTQFGWLPRIYVDAGVSPAAAGGMTALIAGLGAIGGLTMPLVIARTRWSRHFAAAFGLMTAAGYLGLLLAPVSGAVVWAVLLGVGGFAFPMVIALIPARSRNPVVTARLSGLVQPIGYIGAALGPLEVGVLFAATGGSTTVILLVLLAAGLVLGLVGWRAARDAMVDDELHARTPGMPDA